MANTRRTVGAVLRPMVTPLADVGDPPSHCYLGTMRAPGFSWLLVVASCLCHWCLAWDGNGHFCVTLTYFFPLLFVLFFYLPPAWSPSPVSSCGRL